MSYVIVKFDVPSLAVADLYVVNGEAAGPDACHAPFAYVLDGFGEACETAAQAARLWAERAAYAVFNVSGMGYSFSSDLVPDQLHPLSPLCAIAPVYVPAPSSGLWARYGSIWERLPFMVGNSSTASIPALEPVANPHLAAPAPIAAPAAPSVRFEVRAGLVGTDRDTWSAVMDFDNGKDAGAWVSANRSSFSDAGKALVIVKVEASAAASDWRERERLRFTDGTYTVLPGEWTAHIAQYFPDHFAHVAQSDKRKVAFTESESSGERDRQKVLSASLYVERFFGDGGAFYWPSDKRSRFVADMLGDSVKPLFAPLGDPDAMEAIYRETEGGAAHGCMSYSAGQYSSPFHPVRVYALGGDITIAFLRAYPDGTEGESGYNPDATWDGEGAILARCLVWPGGNEYGRVYGTTDNVRLLRTALEAQGFSSGDLCGAKIAKVEHGGSFVMPYLDIGGGEVSDYGTYFEVGGDISATRTDGLLEAGHCCQRCDDFVPEDEIATVYTSRHETENWCEGCRDYHAVYTDYDGEYIASDCVASYIPSGCTYPESISEWGLEEVGAAYVEDRGEYCEDHFFCDECGEAFHDDDMQYHGVKSVCSSCLSDLEEAAEAAETEAQEIAAPASIAA